jgi:putative OPT family oligopeptide transporter
VSAEESRGGRVIAEGAAAAVREITPRAIVLGLLLALMLGAANAYLGLFAGMTVSASIPAAVISMAILRALGGATLLENNLVQTIASAGEAVAAGAIFTFPALVILGYRGALSYWHVTILCLAGSTMGSLLIVFLRRAYIQEERLPFPEGVACAQVLRAGEAAGRAMPLVWGGAIAALAKAAQEIGGFVPRTISGARWIAGGAFSATFNLSGALLGVGYIVGTRIAMLVFAGGVLGNLLAIPLATAFHPELRKLSAQAAAYALWSGQTRYMGVGAMLVGGLTTIWRLRARVGHAARESLRLIRSGQGTITIAREDTDISTPTVLAAVGLCIPAVFAIAWLLSGRIWLSVVLAIALVILAFFGSAIAGYLTGLVGASNNPVSGVTVIVLLGVAMLLKLLGLDAAAGARLAIMTGAVVCTAAAMAGDSLHDLATGYHVGATPRALEIGVLLGAIASSFVMAPVLNLLIGSYGIAGTANAGPDALPAPQAFLMAGVTRGVFGGNLPWTMIGIGAVLAIILAALDRWLEHSGRTLRTPVMPVALGLYLPFGLSITILAGSLAGLWSDRDEGAPHGAGLLFAAGLIAGEALMGVASGALVTMGVRLPLSG